MDRWLLRRRVGAVPSSACSSSQKRDVSLITPRHIFGQASITLSTHNRAHLLLESEVRTAQQIHRRTIWTDDSGIFERVWFSSRRPFDADPSLESVDRSSEQSHRITKGTRKGGYVSGNEECPISSEAPSSALARLRSFKPDVRQVQSDG
ncbi:hypothetical protein BLNAU_1755 [Blattamonas nauphoetae]|uniref:Uncharacterized protein n=1 Tax=Blattamonas nauphoetae TaxID=2049346 RepID=A0ABQ9YHK2_9EUKA|nr:hypothetical protein BLNAU_1755 [Blattamonas nauphoetae]